MANANKHTHPLIHGGSSQQERLREALRSTYAQVDERDSADLILFASKYAQHLQFYNLDNVAEGNWQAFIDQDVSTSISLIADQEVVDWQQYTAQLFRLLQDRSNSPHTNLLKNHFKALFDLLLSLIYHLDQYYQALPENIGLEEVLRIEIQSKLRFSLERLLGYYKLAADSDGDIKLIDENSDFLPSFAPEGMLTTQYVLQQGLSELWYEAFPNWPAYYDTITAEPTQSPFGENPAALTTFEKINNALSYNLFSSIFEGVLQSLAKLVVAADEYLVQTLENWPDHTPDMGLYLAFLRLFKFAQDDLNTFTQRHLDFYYREVLGLKEKAAGADQVHILLELAKHIDTHLVEAETALKAGKDSEGNEVQYTLEREFAANKAQITELKSIYVDEGEHARLYAAPIANSEDGLGAELTTENKSWDAFGKRANFPLATGDLAIGFGLASPYLFLNEGKRVIDIELNLNSLHGVSTADLTDTFEAALTTEEGWYLLSPSDELVLPLTASVNTSKKSVTITSTLLADMPAIRPYNQEVHGRGFQTSYPIIKLKLKNNSNKPYIYQKIRSWVVKQAKLRVEVEGLRDLSVQNDQGPLDSSKSFYPFGSQPVVKSAWLIGSKEVWQKNLTNLSLEIEWEGLPEEGLSRYNGNAPGNTTKYSVDAYHLKQGKWEIISEENKGLELFDYYWAGLYFLSAELNLQAEAVTSSLMLARSIDPSVSVRSVEASGTSTAGFSLVEFSNPLIATMATMNFFANEASAEVQGYYVERDTKSLTIKSEEASISSNDFSGNEAYSSKSTSGFIRLQLNKPDFGHKDYPIRYAKKAIAVANGSANESELPNEPYTPSIRSLSLNYEATTNISLHAEDGKEGQFFHIHPFGETIAPAYQQGQTNVYALPQYVNEGTFYIGIENLATPQNISILFQLAEGSAFPLKEPQEVQWSYLCQNEWKAFEDRDLADETENLLQSGIITFSVPQEANKDNSLMPAGLHWLCAHVASDTDATNYFINIHAQAAKAVFTDQANAEDFLETPLEAETISKLLVKDSAIKKITQPYSSFGGRVKETPSQFETRVSERLRHKNRSISIWDYEHLVLEAFPNIYKVKCLSHTRYQTDPTSVYHEIAPGHVSIIPIPKLINRNVYDPLAPYTSLGVLQQIDQYIRKHTSPFVKLHVKNPLLEKIQVTFNVQFLQGLDETIYSELLEEEIKAFLSPWAFEEGVEISFGGKIYKSSIINFVEERTYVDYVTLFRMHQFIEDLVDGELQIIEEKLDIEEAVATSARSILVSKASHTINPSGSCV